MNDAPFRALAKGCEATPPARLSTPYPLSHPPFLPLADNFPKPATIEIDIQRPGRPRSRAFLFLVPNREISRRERSQVTPLESWRTVQLACFHTLVMQVACNSSVINTCQNRGGGGPPCLPKMKRWRGNRPSYTSCTLSVRGSFTRCINPAAISIKMPPAMMA